MKAPFGVAVFLMLSALLTTTAAEEPAFPEHQHEDGCGDCFAYLEFPPRPMRPRAVAATQGVGGIATPPITVAESPCGTSCEPCPVKCRTDR
jgi:hypothetical protein